MKETGVLRHFSSLTQNNTPETKNKLFLEL
jgi:hypothetical protein